MTPQSTAAGSTDSSNVRCRHCATETMWCATGREWPLHCGPCVNCGRETMFSAACGYPHCPDCREPAKEPNWAETEQQGMARTYSLVGWKIFPLWWIADGRCACRKGAQCESPGKHPLYPPAHDRGGPKCYGTCGKRGHGLYDATNDADLNAERWAEYPHAGIGLPAQGNGFTVLDVDSKSGGLESFERLTGQCRQRGVTLNETLTQSTGQYPAGRGFHLLYHAPPDGIKGGARNFGPEYPGLDIRGHGHYIVVSPTLHFSGVQYQWIDFFADIAPWPDLLTGYLNARIPPPPPAPRSRTGTGQAYGAKALAEEVAELRATREGNRNNRLNEAAYYLGKLIAGGELDEATVRAELESAAYAIGLTDSAAVNNTIDSGFAAGAKKPRTRPAA